MSSLTQTFEQYKAVVESVSLEDAAGIWHLGLSDIAKAPGEFMMRYHYEVYRQNHDGTQTSAYVAPPELVMAIVPDANIFDDRVQLSLEDLLTMLSTAKEGVHA